MKKALFILLLLISQIESFSQIDTIFYENNKLKIKGIGKLSDTVKVGFWTEWHLNGEKASEGLYKFGKPDGYWQNWDSLGRIAGQINWKVGIKEGAIKIWNYDKNEYVVASYKNDNMHGLFALYTIDTKNKIVTGTFNNGVMEGSWSTYFPNGNIQSKGEYKNGKAVGTFIIYKEDGSIDIIKKFDQSTPETE